MLKISYHKAAFYSQHCTLNGEWMEAENLRGGRELR